MAAAAPTPMAVAVAESEEGESISPAVLSEWEAVCIHIGLSPAAQAEGRKDLAAILRLGIPPDTQRPGPVPWVWIACSAFVAAVRACFVVKEGKGEGAVPEMGPILEVGVAVCVYTCLSVCVCL